MKVNLGKIVRHYSVYAPTGMGVYDTGILGVQAKTLPLARERNAHVFAINYWFDPMAASAETRRGFASSSVKVDATATLTLSSGDVPFMSAKGDWGGVKTKEMIATGEPVGVLTKAQNLTPMAANALSAGLAEAFKIGRVDRQKGLYVLELDRATFVEKAVAVGMEFNDQVVAGFGAPGAK